MTTAYLERLPSEIRVAILCTLPDFKTLVEVIIASRILKTTYERDQSRILMSIFHGLVLPAVQMEAVIVVSLKNGRSSSDVVSIGNILHEYKAGRAERYLPLPLSEPFKDIIRFQNNVSTVTTNVRSMLVKDSLQPTTRLYQPCDQRLRSSHWYSYVKSL